MRIHHTCVEEIRIYKNYLSNKLGTIPVGWSGTKVLGYRCVYLLRVSSHAMSVIFWGDSGEGKTNNKSKWKFYQFCVLEFFFFCRVCR